MTTIDSLFLHFVNSWRAVLLYGLASVCWSYACLKFAGYLRCSKLVPVAYTRKIFHLSIFISVVFIHLKWGLPAVCVFGAMTSFVLAFAVLRGPGFPLYEAIAREQDYPHRTYYVVIPYLATLIGGVVSNMLFGSLAVIGYCVAGMGDAIGEPVGTRWGKHRYRLGQVAGVKTIEGSVAVLVVSLVALFIAYPSAALNLKIVPVFLLIALGCTFIEASSPRGWDNTPMQVVPTFLMFLFCITELSFRKVSQ